MNIENTESHNQANEAIKKGLRYMARYGSPNPQICQCRGSEIVVGHGLNIVNCWLRK